MRSQLFAAALLPWLFATGCQVSGPTVCEQAADYYAECTSTFPTEVESCGEEASQLAEQVLAADCDDLTDSSNLKSDTGGAVATCVALVFPLLVVHEQGEGEACCVPYNCESGLTCHTDQVIPTCGPRRDIGGSCDTDWQCERDLACVQDACSTPLAAGQSCEDGDCASGLVCAFGTCLAPLASGASCEEGDCGGGLECVLGTCSAPIAEGGTCGDDDDCGAGLLCNGGTCSIQSCNEDEFSPCDMDATCFDGRCEPRRAAGEGCRDMFDCQFGLFCHREAQVCYEL